MSFTQLELSVLSKSDWGSYIAFMAKTASKKIGLQLIPFLPFELVLYLYKYII